MPRFPLPAATATQLSDKVFSRLAARAAGRDVIPLHVGDTWRAPPEVALIEAARQATLAPSFRYAPVQGEPALLDAALEHLDRRAGTVPPRDCVQVVSGATPGLGAVVDALVAPGDEVLLPSPFWPLIHGTIRRRGATPVEVPFYTRLREADFDPEAALEGAVTPRSSAVYVNTPHNPTGVILDERVLAAIARVAARHDLWILCDEVYEDLWLDGVAPPSPWARPDFRARTVAVHSVSKAFGLAGARVGFAHGPPEAMAAVRGVQTFTTYCAPRPMQHVAAAALREGGDWLASARTVYRDAGRRAAEALGIAPPEAGTFVFFELSRHLRAGEEPLGFLERCLDAGVLLTPGSASGSDYTSWARLCFTSVEPALLDEALRRLRPLFTESDQ